MNSLLPKLIPPPPPLPQKKEKNSKLADVQLRPQIKMRHWTVKLKKNAHKGSL